MLEPGFLHGLLYLQARLLPHRPSAMSANRLLPQGVVPEDRQTSRLLHSLDSGDPDLPSPLPSLPHRAANLHSQSAVHDLHDDSRDSDLPSAVHDLLDDDRDADSQSAVHDLHDPTRMPHPPSALRHLLVDGEVLHEESAVHDLHDDDSNLHSQSAVHGLQASTVHPHGDSHPLCATPSAGQAELLRAAHRLPPSAVHGLYSSLPAAVPDLHGRPTRTELCDEVTLTSKSGHSETSE
ncbi:MAG: hypothetical protein FD138_1302 [Planctomycetota bacterium]|nr:MAG: hypothetical protein FD138_1302 [Planctomycetota bacterium]